MHHDPCCSVYPEGLFHILRSFATRYPSTPLFITENGVADEADIIRHAYLVEHLLAIKAAMETGVRVLGYVFWTISDNWVRSWNRTRHVLLSLARHFCGCCF